METDNTNQQVPPQAPLPNSSRHSKIFIIVLCFVLFAAIAIGGFMLGSRKNQTAIQNQLPTSSPTVSQPSPTDKPDETANWKTFRSEKFGFEIKHPPDWGPDMCPPSFESDIICSSEKFGPPPEPIFYFIFTGFQDNPQKENFKDAVAPLDQKLKNSFQYSQDSINNITVYKTRSLPSRSGAEFVYFQKSDQSFAWIGFTPFDEKNPFEQQEKFYKIFDQILSTFQFTD